MEKSSARNEKINLSVVSEQVSYPETNHFYPSKEVLGFQKAFKPLEMCNSDGTHVV